MGVAKGNEGPRFMERTHKQRLFQTAFSLFLCFCLGISEGYAIEPSWKLKSTSEKSQSPKQKPSPPSPWGMSLGVGSGFPHMLSFDTVVTYGRYLGLRGFFAPHVALPLRIEMPSDRIPVKGTVGEALGAANPAYTIDGFIGLGPFFGADLMVFPFGASYFLSGGWEYRTLRLEGDAQSPIKFCPIEDARKEPPCGSNAITTQSEIALSATLETKGQVLRLTTGWLWDIGSRASLQFSFGAARPLAPTRSAVVEANLVTPSSDTVTSGALQEVKLAQEKEAQTKAKKAISEVDRNLLPTISLVFRYAVF